MTFSATQFSRFQTKNEKVAFRLLGAESGPFWMLDPSESAKLINRYQPKVENCLGFDGQSAESLIFSQIMKRAFRCFGKPLGGSCVDRLLFSAIKRILSHLLATTLRLPAGHQPG